jgi:hypothetical protein
MIPLLHEIAYGEFKLGQDGGREGGRERGREGETETETKRERERERERNPHWYEDTYIAAFLKDSSDSSSSDCLWEA